ncbi:MAG: ATP-binding protein [Lachnospiraceae bacterium]|nr:ATP-binding protein [Lachnospiraceae bacterium]
MNIIGRKREQQILSDCLESARPEFLVVYGRRRVGKTYMVREFFGGRFSFYATGVANKKTKEQLAVFGDWLMQYGCEDRKSPQNWREAFWRLRDVLERDNVYREPTSGKRIIFLDELPWMDTARSDFKSALDLFWNGYASAKEDIVLIVCGSATSWVINNLISDTGGFYNRITRKIHLLPFTLKECEELLELNGFSMDHRQIIELYMIFGGIPYYLNYLDKRISIPQNIDTLILDERGPLHEEYSMLFHSLFKNSKKHILIVEAIAEKHSGITRVELSAYKDVGDGEPLTKALSELEQCGFIRRYRNFTKEKSGYYFQLVDPFILFYIRFVKEAGIRSWLSYKDRGGYYAWRGLSFEIVCLNHIDRIKEALGIAGVETAEYAWRSEEKKDGAQIDLLIDRRDDVINVCEMKFSDSEYVIDAGYYEKLRHKTELFAKETNTRKTLITTMISVEGLKKNEYSNVIYVELTGEDLF